MGVTESQEPFQSGSRGQRQVVRGTGDMRRIPLAMVGFKDGEGQVPRNTGSLRAESHRRLTDSKETGTKSYNHKEPNSARTRDELGAGPSLGPAEGTQISPFLGPSLVRPPAENPATHVRAPA